MTTEPVALKLGRVQILRMVAATAVVFYHAFASAGNRGYSSPWFEWTDFGFLGVDLFFVISGFIIYYTVESGKLSAGGFVVRRLQRLVPIYWAFTLLVFAIGIAMPAAFASGSAGEWMTIPNFIASLFFVSIPTGHQTIVFVGWTLEYEMLFYLAVAALLAARRGVWDVLAWTFAILVALRLLVKDQSPFFDFITNPLLVEFVLGVLVADIIFKRRLTLLIPAGAALAVSLLDPIDAWRVFVGGLSGAVLLLLVARWDQARPLQSRGVPGVAMLLGDASYSIYLVQVLTIAATFKAAAIIMPTLPILAVTLMSVFVTVVAGLIAFIAIERPLIGYFRRRRLSRAEAGIGKPGPGNEDPALGR